MNKNIPNQPINSDTELNVDLLEFLALLIEADLEQKTNNLLKDKKGEN